MSIIRKKEKNLNELIGKLNSLSLSYSQPNYELEKIRTEKNELDRQKNEIDFKWWIEYGIVVMKWLIWFDLYVWLKFGSNTVDSATNKLFDFLANKKPINLDQQQQHLQTLQFRWKNLVLLF